MSEEKKNPPSCRESEADRIDEIESMGGTLTHGKGERIHCLSIIGQIEGHYALPEGQKATKYEHIIPLLVSIEEDDEVEERQIVTTLRQDVLKGFLSKESPLGKALLGKKVGDRVLVKVNDNYSYYVEVREIKKGHDDENIPISSY